MSLYTEHAASGLPNPTHFEGEVRFVQAQDQQLITTRSPRIVIECLPTRSILIKIHLHNIYSLFRTGAFLSIRKYEYDFITKVIIEFDGSFQSWLSSDELLMLNTLELLTSLDVRP